MTTTKTLPWIVGILLLPIMLVSIIVLNIITLSIVCLGVTFRALVGKSKFSVTVLPSKY